MNRFKLVIGASLLCALLNVSPLTLSAAVDSTEPDVTDFIRRTIENALDMHAFACRGEVLCGTALMSSFYERRHFKPAWSKEGSLLPRTEVFISALTEAGDEGLQPRDYHFKALNRLFENHLKRGKTTPGVLAHLDLLLTDAFLMYATHMMRGRVNPETVHREWVLSPNKRDRDVGGILETFLASNDPMSLLTSLAPPHEGYHLLRKAFKRYKGFNEKGGWDAIPSGKTLKKGDRGSRVDLLRTRLQITGDLASGDGRSYEFCEEVERAVKKFQARHGLEVDGIAGRKTLAAMNVPAHSRMNQIRINLERWRWLPRELENPHVRVNIADFSLAVIEDEYPVISMKAVVGRDYRRTPVFSDRIRYLVLNPYWTVPHMIAVKDILPKAQKDPGYLEREHIRMFRGWDEDAPEIDPRTVDWTALTPGNFPYRLRQDPGTYNALGRIKFMFPNKFNVYLHDTNNASLFKKTDRSLSSGCIRVEKPLELAMYLLKNQPGWTPGLIEEILSTGETKTVVLSTPMAVHIKYWTAWMDETMTVHLRKDVYNRDATLRKALDERPPRLVPQLARNRLPASDRTDVHMDEVKPRVIAHTSPSHS
jgi:L,D-transpeptidase YcbB